MEELYNPYEKTPDLGEYFHALFNEFCGQYILVEIQFPENTFIP